MKKSNRIYLSREFGEQNRAKALAVYNDLHDVASTSQSTGLELRAALDAAVSLVRGARMLFDPGLEDFVHEIKGMVNAGLARPVLGQTDHTGFQGPLVGRC